MIQLFYATTNIDKFNKANHHLRPFGIDLQQTVIELTELQTDSGEEITRHKLDQAYEALQQPVLVGDDSWSIPALNGFPATNMKQCNHFLRAEDWLRLMSGVEDRRIFLIAWIGFTDGQTPFVTSYQLEAYFLQQARGAHAKAPHLTVVAWKGQQESIAEWISQGKVEIQSEESEWEMIATHITQALA